MSSYLDLQENLRHLAESEQLSCLMLPVKGALAAQLVAFVHDIPDSLIYEGELPGKVSKFGREDEPHVTALYGLITQNADDVKPVLEEFRQIHLTLGEMALFKNDKYHVLHLEVTSPDLKRLNQRLTESLDYQTDSPNYKPHLTLAYLVPDSTLTSRFEGMAAFKGRSFKGNTLDFSDSESRHTQLVLRHPSPDPYGYG